MTSVKMSEDEAAPEAAQAEEPADDDEEELPAWEPATEQVDAVGHFGHPLRFADEQLQNEKSAVLSAVAMYGCSLRYASEELRDHYGIVMAAVKQDGRALEYASEACRAHRETVLYAVQENGMAVQFASDDLQADVEVCKAAVQATGRALGVIPEAVRADEDIVYAALAQDGGALEFAGEALRTSKDAVLLAVHTSGLALQYASAELRADEDCVIAAIASEASALSYASPKLGADREFLLAAIEATSARCLVYAPEPHTRLRSRCVPCSVRHSQSVHRACRCGRYAHNQDLRHEKKFMLCGTAPPTMRSAPRAARALRAPLQPLRRACRRSAIEIDGRAIAEAGPTLRGNREFVLEAVGLHAECLPYAARHLLEARPRAHTKRRVHRARSRVHRDTTDIAALRVLQDKAFMLEAMGANGASFEALAPEWQTIELARAAVASLREKNHELVAAAGGGASAGGGRGGRRGKGRDTSLDGLSGEAYVAAVRKRAQGNLKRSGMASKSIARITSGAGALLRTAA